MTISTHFPLSLFFKCKIGTKKINFWCKFDLEYVRARLIVPIISTPAYNLIL